MKTLSDQRKQMKGTTPSERVSMVLPYYDNPQMLRMQIECWNSYCGTLEHLPEVILVDDASPKTSAVDIVRQSGCNLPIKVFRIMEDIPWNMSGARNLGCLHAGGWIYISDIDMLLPKKDAKMLFECRPLERENLYWPRRVLMSDFSELRRSKSSILFHKDKFLMISGYDEDYCGFYGKEDDDFMARLIKEVAIVNLDDVSIRTVPTSIVCDASTRGKSRDQTRNSKLYFCKIAKGLIKPINPLRFSWQRVL